MTSTSYHFKTNIILRKSNICNISRNNISYHLFHLSDKCNTEVDCADKSDEINCDYLRFGSNYAKELIPREGKDALVVYLNISVIAFPNIDTVNLKFTADYYLNLRW